MGSHPNKRFPDRRSWDSETHEAWQVGGELLLTARLQRSEPVPAIQGQATAQIFSSIWFGWSQKKNIESMISPADLSWICLKDSVHPGFICIWSRVSGTQSLLVDCGHGQLPNAAEAATGDLFSQVLFGNSVWGLGTAGSF